MGGKGIHIHHDKYAHEKGIIGDVKNILKHSREK